MSKKTALTMMLMLSFAASCFASSSFAAAQESKKENTAQKQKTVTQGTPVMWKEPTDLEARDLFAGNGDTKPDLSQVTFVKEDTVGYSPKFRVRDGAGRIWVAKMGSEAQPETAAARLMWAVGYLPEVNYLIPCVQIQGAPKVSNSRIKRCENDGFANVKFEARPENVKRVDIWKWNENPFSGTREFQGLVVMMSLLNNWDLKDENNKILYFPGENGGGELQYIISDLGATFGKTGSFLSHTRNKPEDFIKTKFVKAVERGKVRFDFNGKHSELFDNVTIEQAKWIGNLLGRLSDKQISDAFRAANYSADDVQTFTKAMRERINQLKSVS